MKKGNNTIRYTVIVCLSVLGVAVTFILSPIAQDLEYHSFMDQRRVLGIPNFWNVTSNLPFFLVGLWGLHSLLLSNRIKLVEEMKIAYILFFSGVLLVAFGSGYYHLWPNNTTLVWDRLPMAIAFMALFTLVIGEFISSRLGKLTLWPLIIFGIFSVVYWYITEINGQGDLRLYILVQFLPILLIPTILLCFKSHFTHTNGYWLLLSAYAIAKIFEHFDETTSDVLFSLSGHSLKHTIAALGIYFLLKSFHERRSSK